jgi:NhaP-type Na+/H+ or K+/H+ antiporter
MQDFSGENFVALLGLIGIVIVFSALLSGVVERTGIPQIAIFLALGAILGPAGIGIVSLGLESPTIRVIATLSLVLVLFTDAVILNFREVRKYARLTAIILGPGTLLTAALGALAAWWLLDFSIPAATVLGAALASTDPVLLRGLLRGGDIPPTARQALSLESGMNDAVLLPVVLIAMVFLGEAHARGLQDWAKFGIALVLLGPGAGVLVGMIAVTALDRARRSFGVRRDYESLFALGVAFTAFAAAEAVHSSGFLAAFAAGLTIAALDVELCDCFLDYGEATAEMALLFTFVAFGASLIWSGLTVITPSTLLFTLIILLVRPLVLLGALAGTPMDRRSRLLIVWFGPRGLSSLLLILLPVFAGIPGTQALFPVCALAVLASLLLHGGSLFLLKRAPTVALATIPAPASLIQLRAHGAAGTTSSGATSSGTTAAVTPDPVPPGSADGTAPELTGERVTLEQMQQLLSSNEPVVLLDVRTARTYEPSPERAAGAIRLEPDGAAQHAARLGLPRDAWLLAYCT